MNTKLRGPLGLLAVAPIFLASAANAQLNIPQADLPPNAKPGECYARVLMPARYQTVSERVVVEAASERIEIIPAKYEWIEETIVVQAASERLEIVPARYETRTETIVIEPARQELRTIPAVYETRSERIKVRDAYTTWKKGTGPLQRIDSATGEIMCLVEVPAEYRTVTRQVVKTAARTEKIKIPGKTKTIQRQVLVQKATTRVIKIPGKTETIRVQKMVTPPQERKVPVAAVYDTVSKQKVVSDAKLEWTEILCETNVTPDIVRQLQTALQGKGHYNGAIDGKFGSGTMAAIEAYQRAEGIAEGQLTIKTLNKLGIARTSSV